MHILEKIIQFCCYPTLHVVLSNSEVEKETKPSYAEGIAFMLYYWLIKYVQIN